ncbi:hypothetical protein ACFLT1_06210 [Bacteroidota bacterium]
MKRLSFILTCLFMLQNGLFAQGLYDSYGGRTDLHIDEGTGYFQLGKINGKHFLVTPEGNAFRAIGLNHSHTLTSNNYDLIIADMKSMGFNSGYYQGPQWQWDRIPYSKGIQLLETSIWLPEDQFGFQDVFDPAFLTSLEIKIKNITQAQAQNANLICYFFIDVPVWEIQKYGTGWIDFYKSLSQDSPGGMVWKKWKEENPGLAESKFIRASARQLYSNAVSFVKKYDQNHLIFGDRYIEYHFPESALEESLPFVDGIAIQPKNILNFEWFDEVYEKYKKPIFICDHVTSFATDEYANTMEQVADNMEDFVVIYRLSIQSVMSKPYMVGYNKCQDQDQVSGTQLKQGLYRQNGEPYGYLDRLAGIHKLALDTAYTITQGDLF